MKKNYLLLIMVSLFFLTLTYFSIWWVVLAILVGVIWIASRFHLNRMDVVNSRNMELQLELVEKAEQVEKGIRLEKNMRRKIEEIKKSKTAVLNKISHEMRTPMNGMMGMASLLGQTPLNEEQGEYLETIRNCGKTMITTINDILLKDMLNYSAGEAGKTNLQQLDFNLRECIEDVLAFFASKTEKTGIELLCKVGYDIPGQVMGDEGRLRQILLNLIENAIKNTKKGEIFVGVTLKDQAKKGEINLSFEVKDSGSGMTEDKVNQIMMSLSNSDPSNMIAAEDAGLGLIISDRLVKMMGGELLLLSKPAEGTRVLFNIIVSYSIITQKRNQLDSAVGLEGKKILPNNAFLLSDKFSEKYPLHILVAEDNLINQQFAVKILDRLGYKSAVANNGREVLEMVSHEKFDLIFMDVEMPEMDGLEATRMIRLCLESQPVVIAMTANAMQGDREICMQSGMNDYLSKPVELEEVVGILEKWALAGKENL